ncbi:Leucine-rich repeats and immunoglobulin-like domains protein 3 [Toxocara canis]|uniref:Leucine-rich repeats and immunoglobulin-like domains protein 3 n=1 Tax=Toxocara canis TaxID=6265 RepID=A0A0B2W7B5_TOXCA|nr:Leucine-rich repeats and immunoglobulin-like domains protein 3 [Toxocara canis]
MQKLYSLVLVLLGCVHVCCFTYERCPSVCHCLDTHIDCSRRSLTAVPAMLPSWTTVLELQGNEILEISPTAFIGLDNLISLDLSENQIESFSRLVFAYTPRLQTLILRKNRLPSVPLGIESLNALHRLDLKGNEITNLTSIDISRLAKVDVVDLARNSIQELPRAVLVNLANSKITRLDLSNNAISALRSRAFSSLHTLRSLRLSRNKIDSIEKAAFEGLVALRSLDLSRNRLKAIRALTFSSLISLQNLTLSRNMISSLEDGSFWGLEQLQRLSLAENRLTAVTGGWLYGMLSLISLDLSSNLVSWIEPSVWSLCSTLQWLSLASNRLRSLPSLLFKKLSRLEHLSLADNHIDVLHKSAMGGLDMLASLDLSGNGLAICVEDGSVLANTTLPSLHTLKFASNRVRVIPLRAFHNFPALEYLDLSDNPIASIQEGAFEPLHLKKLLMNTSSLVCDCELKWFPHWLFTSGLSRNTVSTVCLHPSPLQGIDVAVIDTSNLTCVDSSPRARLLSQPAVETKALLGSEVRLQCTGYGASPLEMSWKVNREGRSRVLTHDATTQFLFNRSMSTNGSISDFPVEYLHSEVRLSEIGFSDEAEYQCIVRNHYGSAYSLRAKIVVLQKPQILFSPTNVSILRGANAKLRCSARGVPPPVVKWQKDGGDSFPAAVERRLHVKANDDNLYMVNVTLADAGIYTCHVSNEAGRAQSSAYLTVFDVDFSPRFEEHQVRASSTVFFNCCANIAPPLSIIWYRDGRLLEPHTAPSRFAFKGNRQVLVINEVQASDTGIYSCELVVGGETLSRVISKLTVNGSAEDSNKRRLEVETGVRKPQLILLTVICVSVSLLSIAAAVCIFVCCRNRSEQRRYSAVKESKAPNSSQTSTMETQTTDVCVAGAYPARCGCLYTSI